MGKLKTLACTGLALLLVGILSNNCYGQLKNKPIKQISPQEIIENCIGFYCTHNKPTQNKNLLLDRAGQVDNSDINNRFEKSLLFYLADLPDSGIKYSNISKNSPPLEKMLFYSLRGLNFERKGDTKKARWFYGLANGEKKKASFSKLVGTEETIFSPNYFLGKTYFSGDTNEVKKGLGILEKEYADSEADSGSYSSALFKLSGEISNKYFDLGDFENGEKWLIEKMKYSK